MSVVRHVFCGERLQTFSDAVFAIVATIMVLPLKLGPESGLDENFHLKRFLYDQYSKYLIYLFSFILVVDTWYSHVRVFNVIEQVDDVVLWLNLLTLLFISFLPYSIGLISNFQHSQPEGFTAAVSISSGIIILVGITMIVTVLYAFWRKALLHPEVQNNTRVRSLKIKLLITLLVNPSLALMAEIFAFISTTETEIVSQVFFYSMGLTSVVVRIIIHFYNKYRHLDLPEFTTALFRSVASKTRTEAFSDGIFSIVATLIVLDFTTNIPTEESVKHSHHGSLVKALRNQQFIFFSYVSSFCIVGLLWFVHYGMFQFVKKVTPALSILNTLTLSLVCGIPFVSEIYVYFSNQVDDDSPCVALCHENEVVAIRASVVVTFLAGISQLAFWAAALNSKSKCLSSDVDKHPFEVIQFIKIMIIPTVSGIEYWITFSEEANTRHAYGSIVVITPFLFLLVNISVSLYKRCGEHVSQRMVELKKTVGKVVSKESTLLLNPGGNRPESPASISPPIINSSEEELPYKH